MNAPTWDAVRPFDPAAAPFDAADLAARLSRTRYPAPSGREPWAAGVPAGFLRRLVRHWLTGYDWPAARRRLAEHPQFVTEIDGADVHLVHIRGGRPDAPAIILTHGWPYSFAEMLQLAGALAGDFDVVVPSLPGFVYSAPMTDPFTSTTVAHRWHRLMTERLEYPRYLVYGEDVGAAVSDRLAVLHPESVTGVIAPHPAFPAADARGDLTAEENAFFTWLDGQWQGGRAYSAIQATKPETLAASVGDSPAGLAAWIVEKFQAWSDCGGDVEGAFGLDALITTVMLFWTTESIGTSFRPYLDDEFEAPLPQVTVPAAVIVQQHEREYPRSLAARTYRDMRSFDLLPHGGHFTAAEAPAAVAAIIRRFAAEVSGRGTHHPRR